MSLGHAVFLKKSKMPSPGEWAAEIRRQGFELSFEPFDVKIFSGFLPCMYRGRASGFEYFYERVVDAELEDDVRRRASGFDVMVTLVTHSSPEHHTCALIASAVLTKLTGGRHWHHESNEFGTAAELLAWARDEDSNALDARTAPPPAPPPPPPGPSAFSSRRESCFEASSS